MTPEAVVASFGALNDTTGVETLGHIYAAAPSESGRYLAVGVNLALSVLVVMHVRWLSVVSAAVIVAWILVVRYLGHEFRARADEPVAGVGG